MKLRYLTVVVILFVTVLSQPDTASAARFQEEAGILSFLQQDLDGDGAPDRGVIMAEYMGERHKVTVYDQGHDMTWSDDWQAGTDFENDVWLFQTERGNQTKLIIRFTHSMGGYLAELYDDFDKDGNVGYELHNLTDIEITEARLPTMRMEAQQPWLLPGGRVNYMTHSTLLRPLTLGFMQAYYLQYLPQNGTISYEQEVVDIDGDGQADYELGQAFPDAPEGSWVFRSYIKVNLAKSPRANFEGTFLWPYLGYASSEDWSQKQVQRRPEDLSPPIKVDWQAGRILGLAAFLPSWGLGNQWAVLTSKPIEKHKINELDWEVFAYYDFNGDTVGDVLFRLLHQPVSPVQIGSKDYHFEQVSYAWQGQNRGTMRWDFELEMAGLHELPSTVVEFKDFGIYTVPFEDLLWYYSRPSDWAYATFVAAESNAYSSNEGIWEWGTLEGIQTDVSAPVEERLVPDSMSAQHNYLRGWVENSPADLYTGIREGFRGEYADLIGPASLYFSSIDHRLHLSEAQKGLWNLGSNREIKYANKGGVYLDTWTLLEYDEPVEYLYAPPGYLLYQDGEGVQLFQMDLKPALFTAMPPRNRTEWEELDSKLAEYSVNFEADDFLAMAKQFGEPCLVISDASIRDFRLADEGFRFILTLGSNFALAKEYFDLEVSEPGEYVVTSSDGSLTMEPLAPARVALEMNLDSREDSLRVFQVRMTNQGSTDLLDVRSSLAQVCEDFTQRFENEAVDLYAGASKDVSMLLPIIADRTCILTAQVLDSEGTVLIVDSLTVPPEKPDNLRKHVLQVSSGRSHLESVFLLLAFIGALLGVLTFTSLGKGAA